MAFFSTNLKEGIWVIDLLTSVILTWMKTEWCGRETLKQIFLSYAATQCAWISIFKYDYRNFVNAAKSYEEIQWLFCLLFGFFFSSLIQGGRHVDYVVDQVVGKLIEVVKKKNKAGVSVKPFQASNFIQKYWKSWTWEFCWVNWFLCFQQVKNHIWVFVNCLIENPSFDSQTKENMTLQPKSFGSKCQLSEKFFKAVSKVVFFFSPLWSRNWHTGPSVCMFCSRRLVIVLYVLQWHLHTL